MLLISKHSQLIITLTYHYDDLVAYVRRHFGDKYFAQDVVHDVCLQLMEHPPQETVHTPIAFLRTAMKNRAIDRWRAYDAQRRYIHAMSDIPEAHIHYVDGARALEFVQKLDALKHIIESLPPRQRQVFLLHRLYDMPQQHIADALGISRNMVTQHFSRAMANIQQMWDPS